MRAASYSSDGTARSAVYMTIMLNPVPPHTPMFATESSATCVVNRSGIDSPNLPRMTGNGDTAGRYRNPHSSVAMTTGTAYGRKIASLLKRCSRTRRASSSSANSRASPSMTGTRMRL